MDAFRVLSAWQHQNQELLGAAAGAAKRSVVLVCIRQYSLINVELRRFIECILWYTYFADHPVEWEVFEFIPNRDWGKKKEKPIETAATASINYYLRYVDERMSVEPSGLAKAAAGVFRTEYAKLSNYIHGATPAMNGSLALAFDREDVRQHSKLKTRCHKILKSGCILVAALNVKLLEHLTTTERKYFDRLVSPSTAKKIREKPFGVK